MAPAYLLWLLRATPGEDAARFMDQMAMGAEESLEGEAGEAEGAKAVAGAGTSDGGQTVRFWRSAVASHGCELTPAVLRHCNAGGAGAAVMWPHPRAVGVCRWGRVVNVHKIHNYRAKQVVNTTKNDSPTSYFMPHNVK